MNKKRIRTILRWLSIIVVGMLVLLCLFVVFIEELFEFSPPSVPEKAAIINSLAAVTEQTTHRILGNSWAQKEHGLEFLFLKGNPFTRGWSAGKLTGKASPQLEEALLQRARAVLNSRFLEWMLRKISYVVNSDLPTRFPLYVQQEVYGFALAIANNHPELGSPYFRALHYQAAHDIGHQVEERVLSLQGCTSFAAWGNATRNRHLLIGRNFDFEIDDIFDRFKLVQIVFPQRGIPFISVSWPGLSGVVSGVNQQRIAVTINAGKSDHSRLKGTPVPIITRKILQQATSLSQALAILQTEVSCISESFLVADGKSGEVVVAEKSPLRTSVRKAAFLPEAIVCVNHFFDPKFQTHDNHRIFVAEGSSPKRLQRTRELLQRHMGSITPQVVASILRDTKMPRGIDAGYGHLHAINISMCSHSIILDLTAGVLWISHGPHQSGPYIPIDIDKIFRCSPRDRIVISEKIIAADPLVNATRIQQLRIWRKHVRKWQQRAMTLRELSKTLAVLKKLNPHHFITQVATGDLAWQQGKITQARNAWQSALVNHPYGNWRSGISERLARHSRGE